MGIGGNILKYALPVGITGVFAYPEVGKIKNASQQGKTKEQIFGSVINVGKWMAIPAALAMLNPVSVTAATAMAVAGFILPGLVPDIDVCEDKNQKLSYSA